MAHLLPVVGGRRPIGRSTERVRGADRGPADAAAARPRRPGTATAPQYRPSRSHQLPVRPRLHDPALVQDVDQSASLIVLSRWATSTTVLPARAVRRFSWIARSVAVSRWLVASSKIRISGCLQQRPGDRQPLPLAARQVRPALADDRLVPLGQAGDELVQPGRAGRRDHLLQRRARAGPGRCSRAPCR